MDLTVFVREEILHVLEKRAHGLIQAVDAHQIAAMHRLATRAVTRQEARHVI